MIQTVDNNVHRLRSELKVRGLSENTLILFLTDNSTTEGADWDSKGFISASFNAGMRGEKTSAFEGGHRAAGLIHWPDKKFTSGKVIDTLTVHIDILPTFTELLSLTLPKEINFDGNSLVSLLVGKREDQKFKERAMVGLLRLCKSDQALGLVVLQIMWREG